MNLIDLIFSEFKVYRRLRGGKWFKIAPSPAFPSIGEFWLKGSPLPFERASETEDYS